MIKMQFLDLLGELKQFEVPSKIFPKALDEGLSFDGSSVTGMNPIEESDLVVKPDLETFVELPFNSRVARVLCNIYEPRNGSLSRYPGDSRYILQKNLEYAKKSGFFYNVGPELEFFMFRQDGIAQPTAGSAVRFQRDDRLLASERPAGRAASDRGFCPADHRPEPAGVGGQDLCERCPRCGSRRCYPRIGWRDALCCGQAVPTGDDLDAVEIRACVLQ